MSKNLVIVESPAKAKTIEGFLGKDFTVKSSFWHVRDLVKKDFGVDIENNLFTKDFLNSPLSSSALDRLLSSLQDKEPFIKNFDPNNSYHRLVADLMSK